MISEDVVENLVIARIERDIYRNYTSRIITLAKILDTMCMSTMRDSSPKKCNKITKEVFKILEKQDLKYCEVICSLSFILQLIIADFIHDNPDAFSQDEIDEINEMVGNKKETKELETKNKELPGYG